MPPSAKSTESSGSPSLARPCERISGRRGDIDVLVEFETDRIPGLLGVAGIQLELSTLFSGRRVDLRTPEDLSPYFRQDVLDTAEVQYAKG